MKTEIQQRTTCRTDCRKGRFPKVDEDFIANLAFIFGFIAGVGALLLVQAIGKALG